MTAFRRSDFYVGFHIDPISEVCVYFMPVFPPFFLFLFLFRFQHVFKMFTFLLHTQARKMICSVLNRNPLYDVNRVVNF